MQKIEFGLMRGQARSTWIKLRTMILLRWVAIFGQLAAVTTAQGFFGLQLEASLCYMTIGLSAIGNLVATFLFPENQAPVRIRKLHDGLV